MKAKTLKSAVTFILLIAMVMSVVLGRLETFDLTEGQAFIQGYYYWIATMLFGVMMIIVQLIPTKRSFYE